MPIPKDSNLRLPAYIIYYLILVLVFISIVVSYFVSSFPLSTKQLMVIFLVDMGGYGIVEEMAKARSDSVFGKHREVLILSLLVLLVAVASFLFLFVDLDISIFIMFGVILGIWCCLMAMNWYSRKRVNAIQDTV